MKVYISGPVTGTTDYKERFENAERMLNESVSENTDEQIVAVNPIKITEHMPEDTTWAQYMDIAIAAMKACDAIYVLKGWSNSKGAKIEVLYAMGCGMKIAFEDGCMAEEVEDR